MIKKNEKSHIEIEAYNNSILLEDFRHNCQLIEIPHKIDWTHG